MLTYLKIAELCIALLIKEGVGLGVPSKNYGLSAAKKALVTIMDKQSILFNMLNNMMRVSKLIMAMHMPFITSSTLTQAIATKGRARHQLFKDKYTREINTMKYYNLLK